MDGNEFIMGVVVELDLVGNVHSNLMTANCFACLNIPNDKWVVILATKRGEEFFVFGEWKTLDQDLVQFEALQRL